MIGFGGGLLVDLIGYAAKRYNEYAKEEILRLRGKAQYTVTYECPEGEYETLRAYAANPIKDSGITADDLEGVVVLSDSSEKRK